MKNHFSNPDYVKKVAQMQVQAMQVNPPAIPFRRIKKKEDDKDEVETKKLKIKTDVQRDMEQALVGLQESSS
ncbi:hypothetical protein G9A89_021688 [Geosiphon pyriformis]|nr:hypothetical protein G9A89_021688 [Geosiphon pyriformis]